MITSNHIFWLSVFILLSLLIRDLPYANVVVINKMWIIYLILLLLVGLSAIKFKVSLIAYLVVTLFFLAFVLTLFQLNFFAESIGAFIYFSLWIIFIHKLIEFIRQSKE